MSSLPLHSHCANPCILTHFELGKVRDGKKGWQANAIYTKAEIEALISDPKIPADRRVVYALAALGCLRGMASWRACAGGTW